MRRRPNRLVEEHPVLIPRGRGKLGPCTPAGRAVRTRKAVGAEPSTLARRRLVSCMRPSPRASTSAGRRLSPQPARLSDVVTLCKAHKSPPAAGRDANSLLQALQIKPAAPTLPAVPSARPYNLYGGSRTKVRFDPRRTCACTPGGEPQRPQRSACRSRVERQLAHLGCVVRSPRLLHVPVRSRGFTWGKAQLRTRGFVNVRPVAQARE